MVVGCNQDKTSSQQNDMNELWLGDTGDQYHLIKSSAEDSGKLKFSVNMRDNTSVQVIWKENLTLEDELGIKIELRDTGVVKGIATRIVSLLHSVDEEWKMSTGKLNGLTVIQMTKDEIRLVFCEHKDKKRL